MDYSRLAYTHHKAKAQAYGAAGLGTKARAHAERARYHRAAFGIPGWWRKPDGDADFDGYVNPNYPDRDRGRLGVGRATLPGIYAKISDDTMAKNYRSWLPGASAGQPHPRYG
jgi:hypothetical protein